MLAGSMVDPIRSIAVRMRGGYRKTWSAAVPLRHWEQIMQPGASVGIILAIASAMWATAGAIWAIAGAIWAIAGAI